MERTQKKVDTRFLAGMSFLSLLLAYICGGLMFAIHCWIPALAALTVGYVLASLFFVAGRPKMQKADPSRSIILVARRLRVLLGLGFSVIGILLMVSGPGQLVSLSGDLAGLLAGWSVVFALIGYYLAVSSYEYRSAIPTP